MTQIADSTHTDNLMYLQDVVDEALLTSEKPESEYLRFHQLAVRGYIDLRIHAINEGRRIDRLTVSDINTVSFPEDFIDFIGVYVPVNGKIWELTRDDGIVTTTTSDEGTESLDSDEGEGVTIGSEYVSAYYARGGSNVKGYYTVEWDRRRIKLINVTEDTVLLVYKSSGVNASGNTYIPVQYIPAIMAYISYWDIALNPEVPVSQKQDARMLYYGLRKELAEDKLPPLREFAHAIYSTYYPLPKR